MSKTFLIVWKCQMCGHISEHLQQAHTVRDAYDSCGRKTIIHTECPEAHGGFGIMAKIGIREVTSLPSKD